MNDPTTIWINGRFLSRKVTGVERVAHEVLRALAENFLDDHGHVTRNGQRLEFKWVLEAPSQCDLPSYAKGWGVRRLGTNSGHLWEQWDLHLFERQDWLLGLCNTGPLLRRRQLIFFHDAQVFAIPENFDWKFRLWYRALLRIAGRCSRALMTNSHFSKSELVRFAGLDASKLAVLHLGTDHMARIKPHLADELQARLGDEPFVLAVSSASPNKNFAGVVEALRRMPNAPRCVIVGQQYSKVFQSDGLVDERVIHLGYVSDETLAALYQKASCLVYPSFYEGFGLPPLEAMSMGCPVVVSQTSSLPEVCGEFAHYCDPHDPDSIAQAIDAVFTLQQDPSAKARLRQQSQAHAQSFTWKRCAEALLDASLHAVRQDHTARR